MSGLVQHDRNTPAKGGHNPGKVLTTVPTKKSVRRSSHRPTIAYWMAIGSLPVKRTLGREDDR
ncbi:MAG: hypothetical protein WCR46_03920 [Deltaproteobacteria bacterium]